MSMSASSSTNTSSGSTPANSAGGRSVAFRIRGTQWRIVYTMSYDGTCDFVLYCNGPSAQVGGAGAADQSFDLNDGDGQTRVFKAGAGQYQIAITPGYDAARWSITVEDWF